MAVPRITYDSLLQNKAGVGLVPRRVPIAGSPTIGEVLLDIDEDELADLVPTVTAVAPLVATPSGSPIEYEIAALSSEAGTPLYLVRRGSDGIVRQRIDHDAAELFVGVHVTNNVTAALDSQRWSPAVHFSGAGWNTGGSTSSTHHAYIQWRTVQAATASGELHFLTQIAAGAVTSRFSVSSLGYVTSDGGFRTSSSRYAAGGVQNSSGTSQLAITDEYVEAAGQFSSAPAALIVEGGSFALDMNTSNMQDVTTSDALTITALNNMRPGATYCLVFRQDGSGGHAVTLPASIVAGEHFIVAVDENPNAVTIIGGWSDGTSLYVTGFNTVVP